MSEKLDKAEQNENSWPIAAQAAENLHLREMDVLRDANVSCIFTSGQGPLPDNAPHVLFVTERRGEEHFNKTFAVAVAASRQLNETPSKDIAVAFNGTAQEPQTRHAKMTMPGNVSGDRIFAVPQTKLGEVLLEQSTEIDILLADPRTILSLSYGTDPVEIKNPLHLSFHSGNSSYVEWLEKGYNASVFAMAGNAYGEINSPEDAKEFRSEGISGKGVELAQQEGHTINGVIVGAASKEDGSDVFKIDFYSSSGADILMPVSYIDGKKFQGTSASTPMGAGVYKEIAEAYGDRLSPVEMRLAMYMSTDIDLLDEDPWLREKNNPESCVRQWAKFKVNDGGRPWHPRAGAGLVDIGRWRENLDKMVNLKQGQEHEFEHLSEQVKMKFAGMRPVEGENADAYVYEAEVPQGMTIDKIALRMRGKLGYNAPTVIESPSGFSAVIPQSGTDSVSSTTALALEDVKTGDKIRIISPLPLKENVLYMDLYGLENNDVEQANVVQQLRDNLDSQKLLPARMSEYQNAGQSIPDTQNIKADYNPF